MMENSDGMDPLEKIMQEFEASEPESNFSAPAPTELPHRPIILPPQIKEEPTHIHPEAAPDSSHSLNGPGFNQAETKQDAPLATGEIVESHKADKIQVTPNSIDELVYNQNDSVLYPAKDCHNSNTSHSFGESLMLQQQNNQLEATQINPHSIKNAIAVNEIAASHTLDAIDATTTEISACNDISLTTKSTEKISFSEAECPPPVPPTRVTSEPHTVTKTTTYPLIGVKSEALEDGELPDEEEEPEGATAKESDVPSRANQQGELITRIKPEPIDKNVVIMEQGITSTNDGTTPTINEATRLVSIDNYLPYSPVTYRTKAADEHEPEETLPDSFFDDLLQNADDITAAALQAANPPAAAAPTQVPRTEEKEIRVKSEANDNTVVPATTQSIPIPENFFDDLLVDHVAERVEDVVNHDLEVKYSERLKELEQLETIAEHTSKAHKKHKKKKKKSHKRSHAEAMEADESIHGKHKRSKHQTGSPNESLKSPTIQQPMRIRVKSEFTDNMPIETITLDEEEQPSTSAAAAAKAKQPKPGRLRIKSEFATFPMYKHSFEEDVPDISLPVRENEIFERRSKVNRNGLIIDMTAPLGFKRIKMEKDVDKARDSTPKPRLPADKIQRAKQRALDAIEEFKKASKEKEEPMSTFLYTATIKKLPPSSSYFKQQIFENRSPLNNVNNVVYKFNSHAFRLNLYEWGLEEMPHNAAKVAKILGFDIFALNKKMETFKIPLKLQKIKKERMDANEDRMSQPSFLITVATQTNEVTVLDAASARRKNGHDIGVQAIPACSSFGTQTFALTGSSYDDLPLMRQISILNENQLMALSDFVELITEPAPEASAIDLFRLRQRMMDIYKCSQEPSALESVAKQQQQPVTNSNTKNIRDPRNRVRVMAPEEEEPPPPPSAQARMAQTMHNQQRPPQQQQRTAPQPHRTTVQQQRPPAQQQKIPVIANVQSYHPSSGLLPPASAMQASTSRYYGRGGKRR